MTTKKTAKLLGLYIPIELPFSDADSMDEFFGEKGACFNMAVQNYLAHNLYQRIRSAMCQKLAEISGEPFDKIKETQEQYFNRIMVRFKDDKERYREIEEELIAVAKSVDIKPEKVIVRNPKRKMAEQLVKMGLAHKMAASLNVNIEGLEGNDLINELARALENSSE